MNININPGETITLTITCGEAQSGGPDGAPKPDMGISLADYANMQFPGVQPGQAPWPTGPNDQPLDGSMVWAGEGWVPA